MISADQFDSFIDRKSYKVKRDDLLRALIIGAKEANINTLVRWSMWLAQTCHETGGFNYFVEQGNASYFKKYDNRSDLGNGPHDGYKYRGRGFLQLTGRSNYTKAAAYLDLDLVNYPEIAGELTPGARIASMFWSTHKLNIPSDKGDIIMVTKRINGGLNGLDDRKKWYDKAKKIFGV